jgi:hypothetical protein
MSHAEDRAAAVMSLKSRVWGHHPGAAMTMDAVDRATGARAMNSRNHAWGHHPGGVMIWTTAPGGAMTWMMAVADRAAAAAMNLKNPAWGHHPGVVMMMREGHARGAMMKMSRVRAAAARRRGKTKNMAPTSASAW